MLYLYAIIDQRCARTTLPRGIGDACPEILPFEDFSVVAGWLAKAPPRDNSSIQSHMTVLNALMQQCTVLPVRFGTVFTTSDDLSRSVAEMRGRVLADLARLHGQAEFGVCATMRDGLPPSMTAPNGMVSIETPSASQGPGFRYIAVKLREQDERLREKRANEELAARVCAPFTMLASEHVWHALPSSAGRGISAAFLLAREHFNAFQRAVVGLRHAEPDLDILCTGPWPPFTFVSDGARTFAEGVAHGMASRVAY